MFFRVELARLAECGCAVHRGVDGRVRGEQVGAHIAVDIGGKRLARSNLKNIHLFEAAESVVALVETNRTDRRAPRLRCHHDRVEHSIIVEVARDQPEQPGHVPLHRWLCPERSGLRVPHPQLQLPLRPCPLPCISIARTIRLARGQRLVVLLSVAEGAAQARRWRTEIHIVG